MRWLAASLVSHAPVASWKVTSAPTTTEYQSISSCSRVVLRLKWWNFGLMVLVVHEASLSSRWSGSVKAARRRCTSVRVSAAVVAVPKT